MTFRLDVDQLPLTWSFRIEPGACMTGIDLEGLGLGVGQYARQHFEPLFRHPCLTDSIMMDVGHSATCFRCRTPCNDLRG